MNNDLLNVELCVNTGEYIAWWITEDGGTQPSPHVPKEGVFKGRLCLEFHGNSVAELEGILRDNFSSLDIQRVFKDCDTLGDVLKNSLPF